MAVGQDSPASEENITNKLSQGNDLKGKA